MSPLKRRADGIVPAYGATDLTGKEGCLVTLSEVSGKLTATLSASATVKAKGVILEGAAQTAPSTIAILGATCGTVDMKAAGAIAKGAFVTQNSDEYVITDAGSGGRVQVGVAIQSAVSGDLFEVAPFAGIGLS